MKLLPEIMQKGFSAIFVIIGVLIVITLIGGIFYLGRVATPPQQQQNTTNQTPPPVEKVPKIIGIEKVNNDGYIGYRIKTSVFSKPMWLCIQPDFYSKPSSGSKGCNSGGVFSSPEEIVYGIRDNSAVLRLYSDSEHTQLYDEVLILELKTEKPKITRVQEECGKLVQNSQNGNLFIGNTRLLTSPGWADLVQFVNEDVCVQGELYGQTSSIRVYFIERMDTRSN